MFWNSILKTCGNFLKTVLLTVAVKGVKWSPKISYSKDETVSKVIDLLE